MREGDVLGPPNSRLLTRGPGQNCPPTCPLPSRVTSALSNALAHLGGPLSLHPQSHLHIPKEYRAHLLGLGGAQLSR